MSKSSKKSVKKTTAQLVAMEVKHVRRIAAQKKSTAVLTDSVMRAIDKGHRVNVMGGYQMSLSVAASTFKKLVTTRSKMKRNLSGILARHPNAKIRVTSRNIYISL